MDKLIVYLVFFCPPVRRAEPCANSPANDGSYYLDASKPQGTTAGGGASTKAAQWALSLYNAIILASAAYLQAMPCGATLATYTE